MSATVLPFKPADIYRRKRLLDVLTTTDSVEVARDILQHLSVATQLALLTLDAAPVHGDEIALSGVVDIFAGLARLVC